jgi:hypothetical protein
MTAAKSAMLSADEFQDTADLLTQLGRSRSAIVRRNTIVAWSELIGRTQDVDLRKQAVGRLIDTALAHAEDTDADAGVRGVAAEQLIRLDQDLIAEAEFRLRAELSMRKGPERARRAAEIAQVLTAGAGGGPASRVKSARLAFASYLSLLRLSLSQWFLTFRDGLGFFLMWSVALGAAQLIATLLIGLNPSSGDGQAFLIFLVGSLCVLIGASVSSAFAVPAPNLRGLAQLFDAVVLASVISSVLAIFLIMMKVSGQETYPAIVASFVGIVVSRLVAQVLSTAYGGGRVFGNLGACLVGWAVAYIVLALLPEDGETLGVFAFMAVGGVVIGAAWVDYRRGGARMMTGDVGRDRVWRYAVLAICAAAALFMGTTYWLYTTEALRAQRELVAEYVQPGQVVGLNCGGGAVELPAVANTYYSIKLCDQRGVRIVLSSFKGVVISDGDLGSRFEKTLSGGFLSIDESPDNQKIKNYSLPFDGLSKSASRGKKIYICYGRCVSLRRYRDFADSFKVFMKTWHHSELVELSENVRMIDTERSSFSIGSDSVDVVEDELGRDAVPRPRENSSGIYLFPY